MKIYTNIHGSAKGIHVRMLYKLEDIENPMAGIDNDSS